MRSLRSRCGGGGGGGYSRPSFLRLLPLPSFSSLPPPVSLVPFFFSFSHFLSFLSFSFFPLFHLFLFFLFFPFPSRFFPSPFLIFPDGSAILTTVILKPTALQAYFHVGPIIFLLVRSVIHIDHLSLLLLCIIEEKKHNFVLYLKCTCICLFMRNMKINEMK